MRKLLFGSVSKLELDIAIKIMFIVILIDIFLIFGEQKEHETWLQLLGACDGFGACTAMYYLANAREELEKRMR